MLQTLFVLILVLAAGCAGILAGMIVFGKSEPPPPLASIGSVFDKMDFSDLPRVEKLPARGGGTIGFRHWHAAPANGRETLVIAIHGSAGSGISLHPLAKALAAEGMQVYAPDIRGHGETGRRGDIDYAGQLDDDLEDFAGAIQSRHPGARLVLLGSSAGGGFALHAAASRNGGLFERAVLLAPMLGAHAPTFRKEARAWARPFIPRYIAISILNRFGIHALDHLPVIAFAIDPARAPLLAGTYSFRLLKEFGTRNYAAGLRRARVPLQILVGAEDDLFDAGKFEPTVHAVRPDIPVTVIPGVNHIGMIADPRAVPAVAAALKART